MNLTGGDSSDATEGDLLRIKKQQRDWQSPSMKQQADTDAKVKQTLEAFNKMHQMDADDDDLYDYSKITQGAGAGAGAGADKGGAVRDFNPPPSPTSVANQQRIGTENQQILSARMQNAQMGYAQGGAPIKQSLAGAAYSFLDGSGSAATTTDTTPLTAATQRFSPLMPIGQPTPTQKEGFTYLGASTSAPVPNRGTTHDVEMYRIGGAMAPMAGSHPTTPTWQSNTIQTAGDDMLLKKLNYMIHLLEEQKDDRTGNATEEILLYSFLGVFMIFLVDSFTRVGKYVR